MDTTGLITINGSRALIESSIRARLMALHSKVHFHCGCWAAAPLWSADGSCMEGALVVMPHAFGGVNDVTMEVCSCRQSVSSPCLHPLCMQKLARAGQLGGPKVKHLIFDY